MFGQWLLLLGACVGPWPEVRLSGTIDQDLTLEADRAWLIDGVVFVEDATLTIEPGTTLRGTSSSALVITRSGRIEARGTATEPIVFTSDQPTGARAAGDWGGLVLLGRGVVHEGTGAAEGIDESDARGTYGGQDDQHSCGALQYVRVEFAGFFLDRDSDLNGLTLAGCGSGTIVDFVQTHATLDDGVEVVGGTVDIRHLLVSYPNGQGLDWSEGWRGNVQYLIIQHGEPSGSAVEGENNDDELDEMPRSAPTIYNATLLGVNDDGSASRGIILRAGTAGMVRNSIISGFGLESIDIRDRETTRAIESGELEVSHTLLAEIGPRGDGYFDAEDDVETDDDDFDESAWFFDPKAMNASTSAGVFPNAMVVLQPDGKQDLTPSDDAFTPAGEGLVANTPAARTPEDRFWDESANYVGAVRPGADAAWWTGWTEFPAN